MYEQIEDVKLKLHFHKCEIKTFLLPCLGDNKIKMHCLKFFCKSGHSNWNKMAHTVLHKELEDILFANF